MGSATEDEYVAFVTPRLAQLRRAAYLLCGDWERGDDTLQRALTDLYAKWSRARNAENLDAYLRAILFHRFIDEQRGRWAKVKLVPEMVDRPAPPGSDPAEGVDVRAALTRLPPRQRAVLVLRYLCDMSVEETAVAMGCSTGTVKSQTSRALIAMRRLLSHSEELIQGERP